MSTWPPMSTRTSSSSSPTIRGRSAWSTAQRALRSTAKTRTAWAAKTSEPKPFQYTKVEVSILVNTTPGFSYQLQVMDNLTDPLWTNFGPAIIATADTHEFTDATTGRAQRFYRVIRTP